MFMSIESIEEILKIVLTQFCCPSPGSRDGSIPYKNLNIYEYFLYLHEWIILF